MRTFLLLLLTCFSFLSQGQTIYVNHAATGANDGTSWANAYVSLQTAMTSINTSGKSVWIAQGTYKPSASNRLTSFVINESNISLYGGFIGTETLLTERNVLTNKTILSGDLSGNDNATISFTNPLRNDNSYRILTVNANNSLIDGLVFTGGHANGSTNQVNGAAIYKVPAVLNLNIINCEFKNNVSLLGGAGIHAIFSSSGSGALTIENSIFENNLATLGTSIYSYTNAPLVLTVAVSNSLFNGNKVLNNNQNDGYAGSGGWFRAVASNSTLNASLTNNTYVNNLESGTDSDLYNSGTVGFSKEGIASISLNATVNNCIFWNNKFGPTTNAPAINNFFGAMPSVVVNNSLSLDNFSTIATKYNVLTGNPLFVSTTDFNLSASSPAINAGDNTFVNTTTDLNGNNRIANTTVDMGAYEYAGLCGFSVYPITDNTANVSWNSSITTDLLYVISGQPIASGTTLTGLSSNATILTGLMQNTNYELYSSAACSSTVTSGWYLVNTFRTKGVIYVSQAATGANNGSSWTDAYTTLWEALLNVAPTSNEIRVAQGVYKPDVAGLSDPKLATFLIPSGAKIYGGFNGTETTFAQRDPKINITILNGDLNGNDSATIQNTDGSRSDNTFHIISLVGNVTGVVVDGLTISGGNANVVDNANFDLEAFGGAIFSRPGSTIAAQFNNCIIEKNTGSQAGVYGQYAGPYANPLITSTTVDFTNCIIRNNQSAGTYANIQIMGYSGTSFGNPVSRVSNSKIINCLFHDNVSLGAGNQGASCITVLQSATAGGALNTAYVDIINSTFTKNNRTNGGEVLSFSNATNAKLINSIIYNNNNGGATTTTSLYLHGSNVSMYPTGINNIIQGGQLGGINANPLFVSASNFHLTSTSPAINAGNNAYVVGVTTDLDGNARIVNTTVDLGAYEFDPALSNSSFTSFNEFKVYPNPTSGVLNISSDEEIQNIAIYSLLGRKVGTSTNTQMDISNLAAGVYLLKLETKDGKTGTRRIVKQ